MFYYIHTLDMYYKTWVICNLQSLTDFIVRSAKFNKTLFRVIYATIGVLPYIFDSGYDANNVIYAEKVLWNQPQLSFLLTITCITLGEYASLLQNVYVTEPKCFIVQAPDWFCRALISSKLSILFTLVLLSCRVNVIQLFTFAIYKL